MAKMSPPRAQQIVPNDRIQAAVSTQQHTADRRTESLPPKLFAGSDANCNDLVLGSDCEESSASFSSIVRKAPNQWIDPGPDSPALCVDGRIAGSASWKRSLNHK